MRYREQTLLGCTSEQNLCLLKPRGAITCKPQNQDSTLKLPDEILSEILGYLSPGDWNDRQKTISLLFICTRWTRLYRPSFYRRLDLGDRWYDKVVRCTRLLKTLMAQPALAKCVRDIPVILWEDSSHTLPELLKTCTEIRSLSIHAEWANSWPMVNAISKLAHLENLRLSGYCGGVSLIAISKIMDLAKLRSLELCRYGVGRDSSTHTEWPVGAEASAKMLSDILPKERYRTSNISKMTLSDPVCSPNVSLLLVSWPASLTDLVITSLCDSRYGAEYTPSAMRDILNIHAASLQRIELDTLCSVGHRIPDFSQFSSLESLRISSYNIFQDPPSIALSKLCSPSLRFLSINFWPGGRHAEDFREFAANRVQWLTEIAASKASEYPSCGLEEIHIGFQPDMSYVEPEEMEDKTWPWQYLEQAKAALASHGLKLTWTKPRCTREAWEEVMMGIASGFYENGEVYYPEPVDGEDAEA